MTERANANKTIGNVHDAVADYDQALNIKPNHIDYLKFRAECNETVEEFKKSIDDYEAILKIDAAKENKELMESVQSKINYLNEALPRFEKANSKKREGNEHFVAKRYYTALVLYNDAIKLWPKNPAFYCNRAACHVMMFNYKLAIEECKLALDIDNKFSRAYDRMVKCYLIIGDVFGTEMAIEKWKQIQSKSDTFWECQKQFTVLKAFENKAMACMKKHDFQNASKSNDRQEIFKTFVHY